MSVIVKICGITNAADALVAAEAGADAIGFVFCPSSPRCVSLETAGKVNRELPPSVMRVGVFVDAPEDLVWSAIRECRLNLLQFHGKEPPEDCVKFGVMSMKAFRVKDAASLEGVTEYPTDAWLLDAYAPDRAGGTGATFNWELAREAQRHGRPIFLAGGLTPENVTDAIRKVQPFGVDVSSGVEASPGRKDHAKVKAFVAAAKAA
jgi:phosphoribosylanthranilate isomerase